MMPLSTLPNSKREPAVTMNELNFYTIWLFSNRCRVRFLICPLLTKGPNVPADAEESGSLAYASG